MLKILFESSSNCEVKLKMQNRDGLGYFTVKTARLQLQSFCHKTLALPTTDDFAIHRLPENTVRSCVAHSYMFTEGHSSTPAVKTALQQVIIFHKRQEEIYYIKRVHSSNIQGESMNRDMSAVNLYLRVTAEPRTEHNIAVATSSMRVYNCSTHIVHQTINSAEFLTSRLTGCPTSSSSSLTYNCRQAMTCCAFYYYLLLRRSSTKHTK